MNRLRTLELIRFGLALQNGDEPPNADEFESLDLRTLCEAMKSRDADGVWKIAEQLGCRERNANERLVDYITRCLASEVDYVRRRKEVMKQQTLLDKEKWSRQLGAEE